MIPSGTAFKRRDGVFGDLAGLCVDRPDLVSGPFREPHRVTGPAVIPNGAAFAFGRAYSVILSVVGLIMPILPVPNSVNQRLPSGPRVMRKGSASGVGVGNSEMAWVTGSMVPILSAREFREPDAVARPGRNAVGPGTRSARNAEFGNRCKQAARFESIDARPVRPGTRGARSFPPRNERRDPAGVMASFHCVTLEGNQYGPADRSGVAGDHGRGCHAHTDLRAK